MIQAYLEFDVAPIHYVFVLRHWTFRFRARYGPLYSGDTRHLRLDVRSDVMHLAYYELQLQSIKAIR